jgi:uncharacterized protein (TIGR00369 family)
VTASREPPQAPAGPAARRGLPTTLAAIPEAALHTRLGIEILEASPHRVVGRMPVAGNTQPAGLLHGGASCVLGEGLASTGAILHGAPDRMPVGLDLNATHHRAVTSGWVTGVATPLHLGRTVATYQVFVRDDADRLVCSLRLTCLLRPLR